VTIDATLKGSESRQLISRLAASFGVDEKNASKATDELTRALTARVERSMLSRGGVADVLSLATNPPAATESGNLASQDLANAGNHILDVLIGNKHISRGIAGRAASRAKINTGTVEKMLPVVAAFLIEHLGRKSQPALENLVRSVPELSKAGGSPLPMPRGLPNEEWQEPPAEYVPASGSTQTAPPGPIDAGPPLPVPGDDIPGLGRERPRSSGASPYDRLPEIIRRGAGPKTPDGDPLSKAIRSILQSVFGNKRGIIGTMIQLFLIRWIASIARRVLSRVASAR
jgi:hypothetical protein